MSEQKDEKLKNVEKEPKKMQLGEAMDLAEYAVKGKSLQERKMLEQNLAANDNAEPSNSKLVENKDEENELNEQQKEIIAKLNTAKNSEQRVKIFATLADDMGFDPLISLIPGAGDGVSSAVAGLYLLFEAQRAGLDKTSYLKIIGLQAADLAVGLIPVEGDVADALFKATKWSVSSFSKKTEELVKQARKAGVPEKDIEKITASANKLPSLVDHAVSFYKFVKGKGGKSDKGIEVNSKAA